MRQKNARREFLKRATATSAGVLGFPYIVPASTLGKDGTVAPSNRHVMGCIGMGGRGRGDMKAFMGHSEVQVVAVCDAREGSRNAAKRQADGWYKNQDCVTYRDYRELCAREDIDTVLCLPPPPVLLRKRIPPYPFE